MTTQLTRPFRQFRIDVNIELDAATDFDTFRRYPQLPVTLGILGSLGHHPVNLCQHLADQRGNLVIASHRFLRQAPIGNHDRNGPCMAGVNQVGPQFGFHDHGQRRPDTLDKALCRTGIVNGQQIMPHLPVHQLAHLPGASGGHGRHDHGPIRIILHQTIEQGSRRHHLTDGSGMNPDRRCE